MGRVINRYGLTLFFALAVGLLVFSSCAFCQTDRWPTSPVVNGGKKWRIGYLEGGVFYSYEPYLAAVVKGLMDLGWIEKAELPRAEARGDNRTLWSWLVREAKSNYLEFVPDAYWSCEWDGKKRERIKGGVLARLGKGNDIDLMIAMGTWAGQDLANESHSVPTIVMCTSNAVSAGIIKSPEESGWDHIHARVVPSRYENQIRLFHECIGFKRLGVAYEDTPAGRTYGAIEDIRKVAAERHFEVVECHSLSDVPDQRKAYESLLACHEELAPKVDAMYLTIQNGMEIKDFDSLIAPFYKYKVPTFSQRSSEEVKHGSLMSFPTSVTLNEGAFEAGIIAKTLNGAKPGRLSQIYEEPSSRIAINMEAAKKIGYDPPGWVLQMADEIYSTIATPENE